MYPCLSLYFAELPNLAMVAVEIPIDLLALALRGVLQELPLPDLPQDTGLENWTSTRIKPDSLLFVESDEKGAILPDFGCSGSSKEICGLPECLFGPVGASEQGCQGGRYTDHLQLVGIFYWSVFGLNMVQKVSKKG